MFKYLNSFGRYKRSKVVSCLKAYFYPEALYESRNLDPEKLWQAHLEIMQLEQRALYIRGLLNIAPGVNLSPIPGTRSNNVSPNIKAETSQKMLPPSREDR